jgi:hypothetical protein
MCSTTVNPAPSRMPKVSAASTDQVVSMAPP